MFLNKLLLASSLSNKFTEEALSLKEKQDRTLRADVESVLSCREWIKAKTNNNFDHTRILGIVAAAKGAENYLPYTIPKIVQQISEIGMMADIVIGLNNGFECESVIDSFKSLLDVQVIHLYTEEKIANNIPAKIYDKLMCEDKPYYLDNSNYPYSKHRIFILHQKQGLHAAGKIRVLGDIYGSLLLKSIDNGWIPPAILVTFDAETQFLVERDFTILPDNGLKLIVNELRSSTKIDILGTRNKFAVYQKAIVNGNEVLLPNFNHEVPPIQWFINIVHGKYHGYMCKQGGGTVGKTDAIVSLLATITQKYPGSRNEDTHSTILASHAGFLGDIFIDVISTNRTPTISDMTKDKPPKKSWIKQMYRWTAAYYGLKLCYGSHNIKLIAVDYVTWSMITQPVEFFKGFQGSENINLYSAIKKVKTLAIAFFVSRSIRKRSIQNPDILQGSKAKAYW